jgi:uncharacterized repeat protein (TIGR01451 family)
MRFLSTLVFTVCAFALHAQNIFLKTTGETATVCGENITFSIEVRNLSTNQAFTNVVVDSKMPSGVTYVSQLSTPANYVAGSPAGNPAFSIGTLAAGAVVTIRYSAKVDCNLITYLNDRNITNGLINNETKVSYSAGGSPQTFREPNGSESYNVFYPVLSIQVNASDKTQTAASSDNVTRQLTIRNSGNGRVSASNMYVEFTRETSLTFVSITGGNITVTQQGSATSVVRFNSLADVGNGDNYFDPGETISLIEKVRVASNNCSDLNLQTNYFVKWGCNSGVCNLTSNNSQDASIVLVPNGNPQLSVGYSVLDGNLTFNAPAEEVRFTLTNTAAKGDAASDKANKAVIDRWYITESTNGFTRIANFKVLTKQGTYVSVTPSVGGGSLYQSYSFTAASFSTIADVAGLSDSDGDGTFSDILPQDKITISAMITVNCPTEFSTPNFSGYFYFFNLQATAYSSCGASRNTNDYSYFYNNFTNAKLSGPTDLVSGMSGTYQFAISRNYYFANLNCGTNAFRSTLNFPSRAYKVTAVRWNNSASGITFSQDANGTLNVTGGGWSGTFSVDVTLDCSLGAVSQASTMLQWNMYYDCNALNCPQFIGQSSFEIFNHCPISGGPGGEGACLRTSAMTVERTTFGYTNPSAGYYITLPATKLTRNSPGVRLNAALETDGFKVEAKGNVASGSFDNAHVELQYTSPITQNIFELVNASFVINTGSGAQTYPAPAPVITQSGNVYYFDFSISGIGNLPTGTTVDLVANFKVLKSASLQAGEFEIQRFRAFHYGLSSSARLGCESFGALFSIVKCYYEAPQTSFGGIYSCTNPLTQYFYNYPYGPSTDAFPNEFRPIARIRELKAVLAKGFTYRANSSYIYSNFSYLLPAPTSTVRADGTTELVWSSDKLPFVDVVGSFTLYPYIMSDVTCIKDVTGNATTTMSYSNYEFDESSTPTVSTMTQLTSISKYIPTLTLQSNVIVDAFSETVTWPVTLCEGTYGTAQNYNWLSFEPPANINLVSAKVNGVNLQIVSYDPQNPHRKLIKVGGIGLGRCATVQLTASYTNCIENFVDDIALRAGRFCGAYPASPDDAACGLIDAPLNGKISIRYKNADLSQTVTKTNASSNLCEAIPYTVELLSSGLGDMYNVAELLDLPQGIVFRPGSASFQIPSVNSTTWTALPDPTAMTVNGISGIGWDITALALGGNAFAKEQRIIIRFSVEASCSESFETNFDPGIPLVVTALGKTNCDDWVVRPFQSKIDINGFSVRGNEMIPNVSVDQICVNGFAPSISISVTNPGQTPSIAQDLVVTLPQGLDYLAAVKGAPLPFLVQRTAANTKITWKLSAGIQPGATVSGFNFIVTLDDQELNTVTVETRTYIYGNGTCTTTGQQCALRATTGLSNAQVSVLKDNCYKCQEPTPVITGDCAGKETKFNAWSGANILVRCDTTITIWNSGNADMVEALSYTAYYSRANDPSDIQSVAVESFMLNKGGSLSIKTTDDATGLVLSRLEVEQAPFNPENSGIIMKLSAGSGSYCSRISYQYLSPVSLIWNFGDGQTASGISVTHTYQNPGTYTVTLTYCGGKTSTVTYVANDCKVLDLSLFDRCSSDPQTHRWYVYNPNNMSVTIEYQLKNSPFRRSMSVDASGYTYFSTPVIAGNKTLIVSWKNERDEVKQTSLTTPGDICPIDECSDCYSSFRLLPGKQYILSAWVAEGGVSGVAKFENVAVELIFDNEEGQVPMDFHAEGVIVDGWQRIWSTFMVPDQVNYLTVKLINNGSNEAYFDDVRIHPFNANMKSYVYDGTNQKLMAELDENNYATFYEYDEEGNLVRVKRETERGVKTIQETRDNKVKIGHEE